MAKIKLLQACNLKYFLALQIIFLTNIFSFSQSASDLFNKGNTAFELANYQISIQYLSDAIAKKPDWEKAIFIRGKAYLEIGDFNSALDDFNKVSGFNPHEAEYMYYKGRTEWRLNRMKVAIMDLEKALEYNINHFGAHQTLGDLYLELRIYSRAKEYFDKAVALNPSFVPKGLNKITAQHNKEDYQEAMQEFNREIEVNSKNGEAYFNRAILKELTFDYEGAYSDFSKSLLADTSLKIAHYYRAIIKFNQKAFIPAYEDLKIYLKRYPTDPEAQRHMIEVKKQLKIK